MFITDIYVQFPTQILSVIPVFAKKFRLASFRLTINNFSLIYIYSVYVTRLITR